MSTPLPIGDSSVCLINNNACQIDNFPDEFSPIKIVSGARFNTPLRNALKFFIAKDFRCGFSGNNLSLLIDLKEFLSFYVLKHKLSDMMESNALALVASNIGYDGVQNRQS